MSIKFVTKQIHAFLDYPVALSLMVLPFALQLGNSSPLALWLAVSVGVAAFPADRLHGPSARHCPGAALFGASRRRSRGWPLVRGRPNHLRVRGNRCLVLLGERCRGSHGRQPSQAGHGVCPTTCIIRHHITGLSVLALRPVMTARRVQDRSRLLCRSNRCFRT